MDLDHLNEVNRASTSKGCGRQVGEFAGSGYSHASPWLGGGSPMADDVAKPEWIITLVHGTWGRGFFPTDKQPLWGGPRWFQEGSHFLTELRGVLRERFPSFTIEPFTWSGSNSVFQRDSAAYL